MRKTIDINKLAALETFEEQMSREYGARGSVERDAFEAKARAWYYAECIKEARKKAGITQQQLADRIGKKRTYVSLIERGKTDMQLSTFIMMSEAVGLHLALTY